MTIVSTRYSGPVDKNFTLIVYIKSVSYTHLDVYKRQVHVRPPVNSDTFSDRKSMIAEFFLSTSRPTNILKGNPAAIRKIMFIAIPLLIMFNDACFRIVLFWGPVAPINTILLIGKVGNN